MGKEKEIEEMAHVILGKARCTGSCIDCDLLKARKSNGEPYAICYPRTEAIKLYNAGYGNIKQAVKEFAEELKKKAKYKEIKTQPNDNWNYGFNVIRKDVSEDDIDNLIIELYGADE